MSESEPPRLPLVPAAAKAQDKKIVVLRDFLTRCYSQSTIPKETGDDIRRRMARAELDAVEPRREIPGEYACWELWGPGVPCLHPDGVGHVGPHGYIR